MSSNNCKKAQLEHIFIILKEFKIENSAKISQIDAREKIPLEKRKFVQTTSHFSLLLQTPTSRNF